MITLHFKTKSYDLTLYDGFYITTVSGSESAAVESILNALQSGRCTRWKSFFNKQFTVTQDGVEINCDDVYSILLNQFN
jgi:hypothetical protein